MALELEDETQTAPAASSTEDRCPVCLEDYEQKAFVDACFHAFCFTCIVQWSEVANSCPMCKMNFQSIIHDVKSNEDYKTYHLRPMTKSSAQEISINEARRFRYRSTIIPGEYRPSRAHGNRSSRKPASEERRKTVYLTCLRALPFSTDDRRLRIRDISSSFLKRNPAAIHRLLPWLSRDIKVLLGEQHVEFVIQLILSLIDRIDLESPEFADHLRPFFHEKTDHFLHEFISFAKSPLDMVAYDGKVSYGFSSRVRQGEQDTRGAGERVDGQTDSIPRTPQAPDHSQANNDSPNDTNIQQKIWQELASTSWDDSPPIIRYPSPIPEESIEGTMDHPITINSSDKGDEINDIHEEERENRFNRRSQISRETYGSVSLPNNVIQSSEVTSTAKSNRTAVNSNAQNTSDTVRRSNTDSGSNTETLDRQQQEDISDMTTMEGNDLQTVFDDVQYLVSGSKGKGPVNKKFASKFHINEMSVPTETRDHGYVDNETHFNCDSSISTKDERRTRRTIKSKRRYRSRSCSSGSSEYERYFHNLSHSHKRRRTHKRRYSTSEEGRSQSRSSRHKRSKRRHSSSECRHYQKKKSRKQSSTHQSSQYKSKRCSPSRSPDRKSRHHSKRTKEKNLGNRYYERRKSNKESSNSSSSDSSCERRRNTSMATMDSKSSYRSDCKRSRSPSPTSSLEQNSKERKTWKCPDWKTKYSSRLFIPPFSSWPHSKSSNSCSYSANQPNGSHDVHSTKYETFGTRNRRLTNHSIHSKETVLEGSQSQDHDTQEMISGLQSIPNNELTEELSSIDNKLTTIKKNLLKSLLQKERIDLLKRSLEKERMETEVINPTAHTTGTLDVPLEGPSPSTASMDDLVCELKTVEGAIKKGKKQVLQVMKRMEVSQWEEKD